MNPQNPQVDTSALDAMKSGGSSLLPSNVFSGAPSPSQPQQNQMPPNFNSLPPQGQQFLKALDYARQNPTSQFAASFATRLRSGEMNDYAKAAGIDVTPYLNKTTAQTQTPNQNGGGFLDTAGKITGQVLGGVPALENDIPGMNNFATGFVKSFAALPWDVQNLGAKIGNVVAGLIPGAGKIPEFQKPAALEPQGTGEQVGNAVGQITQFFVPGSAEAKAAEGLDKAIDGVNWAEKLGPVAEQLGENGINAVKSLAKIIGQGLISGTSMGGVTAVQSGGDMGQTATNALIGGIAGGLGKTLETFGPDLVKSLQKADFKLSPTQEAKAAQKADSAAQFMTDNKIVGSSDSKYTKLNELNQNLEKTLQESIPKDIGVPKQSIIDNINTNIEKLKTDDPAVYSSARNEANQAIDALNSTKGNYIKVSDVLNAKRSWGQMAFKTAKYATRDPRVSAEGAYAAELGFEKSLSDVMDISKSQIQIPEELQKYFGGQSEVSLQDFNKVYSNAITSKNLTYMAKFKSDNHLVGRLFGLWAGSAVGEAIMPGLGGKILGGVGGEMASTKLPGVVRNIGERMGEMNSTIPTTITKIGEAPFTNNPNDQTQ